MPKKKNKTFVILTVLAIIVFAIQLALHSEKKIDYCICKDGTISYSHGKGTCSQHGGISKKIYTKEKSDLEFDDVIIDLIITPFIVLGIWLIILFFMSFKKKQLK